jgi:hypothetical protein
VVFGPDLQVLSLGSNQISCPASLTTLRRLKELYLADNNIRTILVDSVNGVPLLPLPPSDQIIHINEPDRRTTDGLIVRTFTVPPCKGMSIRQERYTEIAVTGVSIYKSLTFAMLSSQAFLS